MRLHADVGEHSTLAMPLVPQDVWPAQRPLGAIEPCPSGNLICILPGSPLSLSLPDVCCQLENTIPEGLFSCTMGLYMGDCGVYELECSLAACNDQAAAQIKGRQGLCSWEARGR